MRASSRVFQIVALSLLVVCFLQAAWWVVEETRYTGETRDRLIELYEADAELAQALLDAGGPAVDLPGLLPHVAIGDSARVDPRAIEMLDAERQSRLNRYGWEGTFFLLVLLSGMAVILQALRSSSALLQRQQNFLASVSHELKSPLAGVKLSAETLLLRRPEPERVEELAGRIVRDADRLSTLVTNLLDVARLEDGEPRIDPSVQPLAPLVETALREVTPELGPVTVEIDLPAGAEVWADSAAFRTCVRNLISNAAKSTAAADVAPAVVRVSARDEEGRLVLSVADDGLGFAPREARKLFEKFYRSGDEMRRRTKGSGLGLYLVRSLARSHGATVRGTSPGPGRGAEFTLRWPTTERSAPRDGGANAGTSAAAGSEASAEAGR